VSESGSPARRVLVIGREGGGCDCDEERATRMVRSFRCWTDEDEEAEVSERQRQFKVAIHGLVLCRLGRTVRRHGRRVENLDTDGMVTRNGLFLPRSCEVCYRIQDSGTTPTRADSTPLECSIAQYGRERQDYRILVVLIVDALINGNGNHSYSGNL
jgi:hypothetical protein